MPHDISPAGGNTSSVGFAATFSRWRRLRGGHRSFCGTPFRHIKHTYKSKFEILKLFDKSKFEIDKLMFMGVLRLCRNERFFSNIVGDDVLGVPKRMKLISPMAMQKSLFHKNSRHLTTANAYVSGRRGRRPLQGWRVRFRCRVAISNSPTNQNLKSGN